MKKKNLLLLNVLVTLGLILAACSKSSSQTSGTNNSQGSASLSQVNMLLVGTLKLDGTANAVTADEASQLLPLWQAYLSLSTSQTAAEAEVDGLLKQIESTMTTAQVDAVKAMNLTNNDMMSLMQSMGGIGPQGTPNPQSTPSFNNSGGMPSGGFPSDGPSFSTGGNSAGPSGSRPSGGGPMQGGGPIIMQGGPGMGDAGSATGLGGGQMLQGTPDPTMQARFITQASRVNTMLLNVLINKLEALTNK